MKITTYFERKKIKYIIIAATFFLFGCEKQAEKIEASTNPQITIDTLFNKDGCTVYRFYDSGYGHYFARCGADSSIDSRIHCGKSCVKHETIRTTTEDKKSTFAK